MEAAPALSLHSISCRYCHRDALVVCPLVLLQQRVPLTVLSKALINALLALDVGWSDLQSLLWPFLTLSPPSHTHLPSWGFICLCSLRRSRNGNRSGGWSRSGLEQEWWLLLCQAHELSPSQLEEKELFLRVLRVSLSIPQTDRLWPAVNISLAHCPAQGGWQALLLITYLSFLIAGMMTVFIIKLLGNSVAFGGS